MQKIYLLTYPLVNLYPKSSCVTLSFLQVDELASLQVYELLVILYANLRSFIWLFSKQLVHLSSCSLVHLFFFKYMFSCYFVSFLQAAVLLSTLLPYHKQKNLGGKPRFQRCVPDSNSWPPAWQAGILTNWTNAPCITDLEFQRCVRDSNSWPPAWQAGILTNWTNAPKWMF